MLKNATTSTAIAEYSKTESALAELIGRYKGVVYEVTNAAGLTQARKARAEIRLYRTSLEAMRITIKAPALERCRLIDSEAKRITSALLYLEEPIDQQIKNEEQRKENERIAKELAEQEQITAAERAVKEAEEKKLAEARAEIARRQAELDEAERRRYYAEKAERLKIANEELAARLRIEDAERKARVQREEADRQARQQRESEELKARKAREAEEQSLKAERRLLEEEQRKKRQAEEAKQREIQRKQNEILDAQEMLAVFCERFGHLDEFAGIVSAIETYLEIVPERTL